jgi:hypothetical protein
LNHVNTLVAGRWFCDFPAARLPAPHPARGEFREHPHLGELRGGVWLDQPERRSLAQVFAQHFHEPSLGELPLH